MTSKRGQRISSARRKYRAVALTASLTSLGIPVVQSLASYDPTTGGPIGNAPNSAYGLLNLRLGVLHGGLDVSAFVNNLTNADPILGLTHASATDTLFSATASRPRTMGVTGLYRF